jgi:hypothetical protein
MVSHKEREARIQDFFKFSRQEITGLIAAVLVTAFVFSFRDWGPENFDFSIGLRNFILMLVVTTVTFAARFSSQKIWGLEEGYKAEFKVWWIGLGISLVITFLSLGIIPLIVVGSMVSAFMVKHRLGEMRYGFSYEDNADIAARGVIVNLGLATIFSIGLLFFPESYLFSKGVLLNLVMGICSLIPLPQLDGLSIFFGNRVKYFTLIFVTILFGFLLLSRLKIGIIIAVIIVIIASIKTWLMTSEK